MNSRFVRAGHIDRAEQSVLRLALYFTMLHVLHWQAVLLFAAAALLARAAVSRDLDKLDDQLEALISEQSDDFLRENGLLDDTED